MATAYDVIVVGARCAGSPTAMLLARKGYRVLVVDRATFPSDTVSTHMIHAPGVAALQRWGVLDRVIASGCPPVDTYSFDFGPIAFAGSPRPVDGNALGYGPRRAVLDKILVDAAAEAGAEVREHFTVQEITRDGDGRVAGIRGHDANGTLFTEDARVVVGADGRFSMVAKAVEPEQYNEKPVVPRRLLLVLEQPPDRRVRDLRAPVRGLRVDPDERRPDAAHRRHGARPLRERVPPRRRRHVHEGARRRTGLRRPHPRRDARAALHEHW
jgi:2-polyprenyl-6-methoxyphenol hydroxylase-like FAD-dependent oxidoreductase